MAEMPIAIDFHDVYEIAEKVGEGGSGEVFRCIRRDSKEEYAVKRQCSKGKALSTIMNELSICRKVEHRNIVKLIDSFTEDTTHYFVFNMVWGGELLEDIIDRDTYSELDACHCIEQILKGVAYLHENEIAHRDLKSGNVLLTNKYKNAVVKIADFGFAAELSKNENFIYRGTVTTFYMAPEMISNLPSGHAVDVWSSGVMLYIMLLGRPPFFGHDQFLVSQMKARTYWLPTKGEHDLLCKESEHLIRILMDPDPDTRISAQEALKHSFLRDCKDVASRFHRQKTIEELKKYRPEIKEKWRIAINSIKFMKLGKNAYCGDITRDLKEAGNTAIDKTAEHKSAEKVTSIETPTTSVDPAELILKQSPIGACGFTPADDMMKKFAGMSEKLESLSIEEAQRGRSRPELGMIGRALAIDEDDGAVGPMPAPNSGVNPTSYGVHASAENKSLKFDSDKGAKTHSEDEIDKSDISDSAVPDLDSPSMTEAF